MFTQIKPQLYDYKIDTIHINLLGFHKNFI